MSQSESDRELRSRLAALQVEVCRLQQENRQLHDALHDMRAFYDNAQETFYRTDAEGRVIMVSPSVKDLLGIEPEQVLGQDVADYYAEPTEREHFLQLLQDSGGRVSQYEARVVRHDGAVAWVSTNARFYHDEHGEVAGVEGAIRDVTRRKQVEEELRATRFAMDKAADAIYWIDRQARFVYINDQACLSLGYSREELLNMRVMDIAPGVTPEGWANHWQRIQQRKSFMVESLHRHKEGRQFPVEVTVNHLLFEGREYNCAFARDISSRKHQESLLQTFHEAIDHAAEAVTITDEQANIEYVNPAYIIMSGYGPQEVFGHKPYILDAGHAEQATVQQIWEAIDNRVSWSGKVVDITNDGSEITTHTVVTPILGSGGGLSRLVILQRDISEDEVHETHLRQAHKMESLGVLVGGIAHEFNNMLAGIIGNVFLIRDPKLNEKRRMRYLDNVDLLCMRAAEMIKQLLTFSRNDGARLEELSLGHVLQEVLSLTRTLVPERIGFDYRICDDPLVVRGDAAQLQQLLINLVNNARDAVTNVEGGAIRCRLEPFRANQAFRLRHPEITSQLFARIRVEDNGCGIEAKYRDKLFDPFFTTKEVGKGTGLGLAMVFGAITRHGGAIEVGEAAGGGARFDVYLPVVESSAMAGAAVAVELLPGNGETVLVVDDDAAVRKMFERVLLNLGYVVLTAEDGEVACSLFRQRQSDIRLAILDVVMPNMNGGELARRIRDMDAELPILFASGYDRESVGSQLAGFRGNGIIQKPCSIIELSHAVRAALEGDG